MTLIKLKNPASKFVNYDPFFGGMFDDLFNESYTNNHTPKTLPQVNVKETEQGYEIEMAIPGVEKNEVKLQLKDSVLTISAEKEEKKEKENSGYIKREFNFSSFKRSFNLPELADSDSIKANHLNGILIISISKIVVTKPEAKEIVIS